MELSDDRLLGGRVMLRQPCRGYRAAIDPVLLAAALSAPRARDRRCLDVGAGVGAAALCLAARLPQMRITGLELQADLARLMAENIALNRYQDRVDVVCGDVMAPPDAVPVGGFDQVMTNPPYHGPGTPPRDPSRACAHQEVDLGAWIDFCLSRLRHKGRLTLIHRADRLDRVLGGLVGRAGAVTVLPLWPKPDAAVPGRVIVSARKGVRSPMRLLRGITLHAADGTYTPAALEILAQGEGVGAFDA